MKSDKSHQKTNTKNVEINTQEELEKFNKEIYKMRVQKGDPSVSKKLKANIKNCFVKDNIYYDNDTKERLYKNKPEWAEKDMHQFPSEDLKIHLTGHYDQTTFDLINHILMDRENE